MPWTPRTAQQQGELEEINGARRRGLRRHPRSGAGRIKLDASNDDTLVEIKSANKQITLDGAVLLRDLVRARRQGKDLLWTIRFREAGVEAEITLRRVL